MDAALTARLEALASSDRFSRYGHAAASDMEAAALYLWNIELTSAMLPAIAILEVGLRNAVHSALTRETGTEFWFQHVLQPQRWQNVQAIIAELQAKHGKPPTAGKVIAELTFGFWPHILAERYKRLWWSPPQPLLAQVAPNLRPLQPSHRKLLMHRLLYFNNLRNRAMHHEPIFQGVASVNKPIVPVDELHRQLTETIGWINSDAARLLACLDRFDDVFDPRRRLAIESKLRDEFSR